MQVRFNKFGSFLGCTGYPECKNTKSLGGARSPEQELGADPVDGRPITLKVGPYGPYVERPAKEEGAKPERTSLPAGRKPADVDLAKYRAVTIWCRRFGVNFATAPLNGAGA